MYDNETGRFIFEEYLFEPERADWYEDEDGNLYIVPRYDVESGNVEENVGPDNEIMDALNAIGQGGRNVEENEAEALGLAYIEGTLRRFSEEDGYYHV